jgi:lipopolysaccharide biosynthesis regulator YciM
MLATCPDEKGRDGNRAVQLAMKACELTNSKRAFYFFVLAAAYAEAGQFDKAVQNQNKAMEDSLLRQSPVCRQCLELFKQKKPYRKDP